MRNLTAILFAITLTFAGGVSADPTVEQAKEIYAAGGERKTRLINYLADFENGLGWANVMLEARGDKALYCPPSKLALNGENIYKIAITQSEQDGYESKLITLDALMGLMITFPCD